MGLNVYLAGHINTAHPETLRWRSDAAFKLIAQGMHPVDPCRCNNASGNYFEGSVDNGMTSPMLTPADVILRDYKDVVESDVVLMNLGVPSGTDRPLIGTLMELAWAWEHRIPVIAFCPADETVMRNHPFIVATVTHYFASLTEALRFIEVYYSKIGRSMAL